jgi:hypothetical protein
MSTGVRRSPGQIVAVGVADPGDVDVSGQAV